MGDAMNYRYTPEEIGQLNAEIDRLKEQLSHAGPAIEELTKEREEYRMRWLGSMTPEEAALIRDENVRLRVALGHCKASADGRHLWAIFPVGMDGQIARAGMMGGAAGCFCQHCLIPKSPFHNEQPLERKP